MTFMDEEDVKYLKELSEERQSEKTGEQKEPNYAKSVAKGALGFILTFIGIPVVLFGTCLLNFAIYDGGKVNEAVLTVIWLGFPVVLCIVIAWLTKNIWVIWGLLSFILVVVLLWLTNW